MLSRGGDRRARRDFHNGFDNLEIAELTWTELTTLEAPAREMGRISTDYVPASPLRRQHLKHHELAIRLIVRRGTSALAKG